MSDDPVPGADHDPESDVTVEQRATPEDISANEVARVAIVPDNNGETYTSYGFGIAVHKAETEAEALRQHADAVEEHVAPGPNDKGYISGPRSPRHSSTSTESGVDSEQSNPSDESGIKAELEQRWGITGEQLNALVLIVSGMLMGGGLVSLLL